MHPADALWARHEPPGRYPDGVVRVRKPIPGRAFFPGGFGLWDAVAGAPLPPMPVGGVMVLGHDFHSEDGYEKSLKAGEEPRDNKTWSNLLPVLDEVGISRKWCFFTNLYMGLRATPTAQQERPGVKARRPRSPTMGKHPGASDADFVSHCRAFLVEQLRVQRPALILSLGKYVPPALGTLSPELAPWAEWKNFGHIDKVGAVQSPVTVGGIDGYQTTVVALLHPCQRRLNLPARRYGSAAGAEAELAMIRVGMALAGVAANPAPIV